MERGKSKIGSTIIQDKYMYLCISTKIKLRPLFKCGNYSREETMNHLKVFPAETIQGRKLFKGGNYSRKYGILFTPEFSGPVEEHKE